MAAMHSYQLALCDLKIAFRTEAAPERVERARKYVEEKYSRAREQGGQIGRDRLLAMLLISMADDLLELRSHNSQCESRLDVLLQNLMKTVPGEPGLQDISGINPEVRSR